MNNTERYLSGTILDSLFPSFVHYLPSRTTTYGASVVNVPILSGPGAPSAAWLSMFDRWQLPVHLNGGTLAMQQAGVKYLPKADGEANDLYLNRLTSSILYGAYSRTVKTLSDMPFMTPMTITNLPPELEYLIHDADGEDQTLSNFSKSLLQDLFNFGIAHILVEYPEAPREDLTLEEEKELNMRPYFSRVDPMRLIGWKYDQVGAKKILNEVRIFEDVIYQDDNNPWKDAHRKQVRVIKPGETSIYELTQAEGDPKPTYRQMHDPVPTSLSRMNLITIYGNRTGFMTASPVLEELAWLNYKHWNKLSDLDNIEHVINIPMGYAFGVLEGEMDNVIFSPHTMLKSGNPDLKVGYLEHSGNAIPANQESLKMIEGRMVAMGAEALAPRGTSTRETGIAKTIDNTKATSILQDLTESLEDGLEKAFKMAAEWLDSTADDVQVNIGDKISMTVDANLITNLIDLAKNKNMTFEDLTKEMQSKKLLLASTNLVEGNERLVVEQMEKDLKDEPAPPVQAPQNNVG